MKPPWHTNQLPSAAAQASALRLTAMLAVASGLVALGREIQLDGLDVITGLLSAQILDLPTADGASMLPILIGLDARVAALAEHYVVSIQSHAERLS